MGGLMGVDPPKLRANRQGQYTQADIDQYVVDREERREIDSRPDADEKLQVATLSQLESARAARDAALQSQVGNLNEAFRFANKDYYDNLSSSFKADSEGAFKTAYDASMRGLYDTYKSAGMLTQAGVDADTAALNMASTTETGNIGRLAQAYSGANENYVTSGKTTIGDALNALSSPTSDIDGLNSQTAAINAFDVAGKVQPYKSPTERSVTDFFTGFNKLSGDNSYNVAASGAGASNPSGASKSVASSGANTQPSSLVGIRSPYGGRSSRVVT